MSPKLEDQRREAADRDGRADEGVVGDLPLHLLEERLPLRLVRPENWKQKVFSRAGPNLIKLFW